MKKGYFCRRWLEVEDVRLGCYLRAGHKGPHRTRWSFMRKRVRASWTAK